MSWGSRTAALSIVAVITCLLVKNHHLICVRVFIKSGQVVFIILRCQLKDTRSL